MNDDTVPALVRTAGNAAVRAYREYLEPAKWSPRTRRAYEQSIRRFCRWAEGRHQTLEMIAAPDVTAYVAEIGAATTRYTATVALTPVRGLFRHLAASGVLPENPCKIPLSIPAVQQTGQHEDLDDTSDQRVQPMTGSDSKDRASDPVEEKRMMATTRSGHIRNELETIYYQMRVLSQKIALREGEIEGLQFGLDLLAKEASWLEATAVADQPVAAEQAKEDAIENCHEAIVAEVATGAGEAMPGEVSDA
jgi:hypothetical protein